MQVLVSDDDNRDATASVRVREVGGEWRDGGSDPSDDIGSDSRAHFFGYEGQQADPRPPINFVLARPGSPRSDFFIAR